MEQKAGSTTVASQTDDVLKNRILKQRQDSIDLFVSGMVENAEKDFLTALPEQRIEAREVVWAFADARKQLHEEVGTLTKDILQTPRAKDEHHLQLSISRIALALYWIDSVSTWSRIVADSNKPLLISLVQSATDSVLRILRRNFFQATEREIINAFLDEEHILTACAKVCSQQLLTLQEAVREYRNKVADLVEACEREMKRR